MRVYHNTMETLYCVIGIILIVVLLMMIMDFGWGDNSEQGTMEGFYYGRYRYPYSNWYPYSGYGYGYGYDYPYYNYSPWYSYFSPSYWWY